MTAPHTPQPARRLDVDAVRADFPILTRLLDDGTPMVYLDAGATAQRPRPVLDAEIAFLTRDNAAVKRGASRLGDAATDAFEGARERIAAFVGASPDDTVFTKNATESLNVIAHALGTPGHPRPERLRVVEGDEILVTEMEHHANLVPWQQLAERTGARLRWIPLREDFTLDLDALDELITERTKVVAVSHQSNVLGTVPDIPRIVEAAHAVGALVVLDACQSVPHMPVDLPDLGVDLAAFSGHKMLGPTGIGVLWGRSEILSALPPVLTGGSMIETVTMERSTFAEPPARFEAGTPPVSQAVGLAAACDYLAALDMRAIAAHEQALTAQALRGLEGIDGIRVLGPGAEAAQHGARGGAISFVVDGRHPHDIGQVLDSFGIQVRVGHHCAWPLHRRYGVPGSTRASIAVHTTSAEIDQFLTAVEGTLDFFKAYA